MTIKKMSEFHEEYKEHCYSRGGGRIKVGAKEMKLLEMFDKGKTFSEIARETKQSQAVVRTRILYAALSR